ncbi:MAG TPA: hypothetical protein VHW65_11195 [Gemmatimonadales bacterium]|jgi:hypothetical protein|nr:hypothetical protein [Gemmatimonadales bacterium]
MRSSFVVAVLLSAAPLAAQQPSAGFPAPENSRGSAQIPYRPIRTDELRAAGFLTENRELPFGRVLGPVTPEEVHSNQVGAVAMPGTIIGVTPPAGAAYQRGDTIMLATVVPGSLAWGQIVIPTGLARVTDHNPRQTLATVIKMYAPIHDGQVTLPVEPAPNPGLVTPVKVEGPTGTVIMGRERTELQQPGSFMFVDLGKASGIRIGDFVEIRRRPAPRLNTSDTIDELMATAQVVHVGDKSSTIKLTRVVGPAIAPGTPVVRVATLPN